MKDKIKYLLFILVVFFCSKESVFAGSLSIWASASNVKVGSTVTISVKADSLFGYVNITSSDESILSGSLKREEINRDTYTYTFTAKSAGSVTVTVTPVDVADYDTNEDYTGTSKSVTLKVVEASSSSGGSTTDAKTYSSDNTLSSLSVDGYDITPSFDKETLEYSLALDASVDKINVKATANDDSATVSGAGEVNLSLGINTIEVKVTAENGNDKIYKITVSVEDTNPIIVNIGDEEYTVVRKNNNIIDIPDGYDEGSLQIDGEDVVSYTNSNNNLVLVILKDADGNANLYVYDDGSYVLYREDTFNSMRLYILDMPSDILSSMYLKSSFVYNDYEYVGYVISDDSEFYLIYAMDVNTGDEGLYVYDSVYGVVSRYDSEVEDYYLNKLDENSQLYKTIIVGIVGVVVILIIISIIVSMRCGKKKGKGRI